MGSRSWCWRAPNVGLQRTQRIGFAAGAPEAMARCGQVCFLWASVTIERTSARRGASVLAAVFVVSGAAIRLHGLADVDLFCDEAQATEIASSLWSHGELNPFRYSRFLPNTFFRDGILVYFPPLSYVVAAPLTTMRGTVGANVAARLPALLGGLVLIALLIPAARIIFGNAWVGVGAAALTVCNGFHIGMSRLSLPYALLPPLLLVALLTTRRALRRGHAVDWAAATLSLAGSAYVNQIALLFWPMLAPCGIEAHQRDASRRFLVCIGAAGAAFLVWVIAVQRMALFANSFFQTTAGYSFTAQLAKLAAPYRQMLAPWPVAAAFAVGLATLSIHTIRRGDMGTAALLVWLAMPAAILLTHSMWILDYHLYAAYPPMILVAAYGTFVIARAVAASLRGTAVADRHPMAAYAAALAVLCWSQWYFVPPTPPRSADEFGSAHIVSDAAAHIRLHDHGEVVIAPVGMAEAYYLERFVHSKNHPGAVAECLQLVSQAPAWVFMGDNYFHAGRLDECDAFVRSNGTLIMHADPIPGFTDPANPIGYALYHVAGPARRSSSDAGAKVPYSGTVSPEPPNSLGKSLNFGRPSRMAITFSP